MTSLVLPKGFPERIKKPIEVVTARSVDVAGHTILDRKLFNILLAKAYRNLDRQAVHSISMVDLCRLFFDEVPRQEKVREALERLCGYQIAVDWVKDGVEHSTRCHYLSYDLTNVGQGVLMYAFDPILLRFLQEIRVYSIIALREQAKFMDKHAHKLYELMDNYVRRDYAKSCDFPTLDSLHNFFESTEYTRSRTDNLKRIIGDAVAEVNAIAAFDVEVEYHRAGRGGKVVGASFTVTPKSTESIVNHPDHVRRPGGASRNRDADTADMFGPRPFARPVLRSDTMIAAAGVLGGFGDVDEWFETWVAEFGNRGFGSNPDAQFSSWLGLKVESLKNEKLDGIDVDAIFSGLLGDS